MFYIDDLLINQECYILKIGDLEVGRAPIKEDFTLKSNYEWQDTDIRSVVDLFMDSMRQTFKNFRQLQGHGQQLIGRAFANDPELAAKGYQNIAEGKTPLDTKYLTVPLFVRAQSAYQLPVLNFIFVNKDDETTHIQAAETFLWRVSGVGKSQRQEISYDEKGNRITDTYESYFTPSNTNKPGYRYRKDGTPGAESETSKTGFTLQKGNLKVEDLSLSSMDISLSKELNLLGYPQAIKISLTLKDTQRRYPAEAIKILQMSMNQNTDDLTEKKLLFRKIEKKVKKPAEKKTT